ncbi:MAG TPA: hypothetical protein HA306_10105 [Methanosarcina sp.]|nr:hypothetical protein [Methanosarcina sp.]
MKGEIVDGSKDYILDLDEHVEAVWETLDDGLTIEIIWEALSLIELYFTLRIIGHILLTKEYMLADARTHPLELIEREFVQLKKVTGGFFEKGKDLLWKILNMHRISGTGVNMYGQLAMNSKKDTGLYGDFIMKSGSTSTHPRVPYLTEASKSSYCC